MKTLRRRSASAAVWCAPVSIPADESAFAIRSEAIGFGLYLSQMIRWTPDSPASLTSSAMDPFESERPRTIGAAIRYVETPSPESFCNALNRLSGVGAPGSSSFAIPRSAHPMLIPTSAPAHDLRMSRSRNTRSDFVRMLTLAPCLLSRARQPLVSSYSFSRGWYGSVTVPIPYTPAGRSFSSSLFRLCTIPILTSTISPHDLDGSNLVTSWA